MSEALLTAIALVLVIEGLLPALTPRGYRSMVTRVAELGDREIRTTGIVVMGLGALLLYIFQ